MAVLACGQTAVHPTQPHATPLLVHLDLQAWEKVQQKIKQASIFYYFASASLCGILVPCLRTTLSRSRSLTQTEPMCFSLPLPEALRHVCPKQHLAATARQLPRVQE